MEKTIKTIIIGLILLVIIILATIMILKPNKKSEISNNNIPNNTEQSTEGDKFEVEIETEENIVSSDYEFFNIKNCAQLYIDYIKDKNYEAIYRVLDKNYKSINDITIETIENRNEELNENKFVVEQMKKREIDKRNIIYFIEGKTIKEDYTTDQIKNLTIVVDNSNSTFSVIPEILENEENYNYNFNIEEDEDDFYNTIIYTTISDKDVILEEFEYYKELTVNNMDKAFELIDDEYKNKRFTDNKKIFEEYLNNNSLVEKRLNKYMSNTYQDYKEYVCIDNIGNYYIIKQVAPMKFSLLLDTYTIEQQETIDRYNKGDEQVKVGMNIEKIKEALNNKDYEYIYNKLDDTFKGNNFGNYEQFVSYMKENFFDANKIEYTNFTKEGELYIYELKVSQADAEENSKKVSIIMKLLNNRDFVMSFSIN